MSRGTDTPRQCAKKATTTSSLFLDLSLSPHPFLIPSTNGLFHSCHPGNRVVSTLSRSGGEEEAHLSSEQKSLVPTLPDEGNREVK